MLIRTGSGQPSTQTRASLAGGTAQLELVDLNHRQASAFLAVSADATMPMPVLVRIPGLMRVPLRRPPASRVDLLPGVATRQSEDALEVSAVAWIVPESGPRAGLRKVPRLRTLPNGAPAYTDKPRAQSRSAASVRVVREAYWPGVTLLRVRHVRWYD